MDIKPEKVSANCHILTNSPALHSLKRQQLLQLCKRNGIKASGKNTELVERLKAHALNLDVDASKRPVRRDGDNDKENMKLTAPRPSEQWTVIEEDSREIARVHVGLKDVHGEVLQNTSEMTSTISYGSSQEFGSGTVSSKGSSMRSTLKAFATSLTRTTSFTRSTSKLSTAPAPNTNPSNNHFIHTEEAPIQDMFTGTSDSYIDDERAYTIPPDPQPLDVDDSRDQSMLELGASTVRLVIPVPAAESPPMLQAVTPKFELSYSPVSLASPKHATPPADTDLDPNPIDVFTSTPPKSPSGQTPKPPSLFLFGSPAHQLSNTQFHSAAASVLSEMNARLGLTGTSNEVGLDILQKRRDEAPVVLPTAQASPVMEVTKKFDRAHERQFERMESLGAWYAKRGGTSSRKPDQVTSKKRKSEVLHNQAKGSSALPNRRGRRSSRVVTPATRRSVAFATTDHPEERKTKKTRLSTAHGDGNKARTEANTQQPLSDRQVDKETLKANEEKEKERAAIRKKLEMSRARRRSSMGRVSMGASRPANEPKRGIATKFGFLSSAKTLVKTVWRGVGMSTAEPRNPTTSSKPPLSGAAPGVAKNPPNILTKDPRPSKPGVTKVPPVKLPTVKPDTSTGLLAPSVGFGLGRKLSTRVRGDSSVATKSSIASSSKTRTGTIPVALAPAIARRGPIPSFQSPVSRTNSMLSSATAGSRASASGTTSSRGGSIARPGSMGLKKSELSTDGSSNTTRKRTTSTLFAPTASSLAKMQSTVRPPSLSGAAGQSLINGSAVKQRTPEMPSFTFTSPPPTRDASAVLGRGTGTISFNGPPSIPLAALPSGTAATKPRALPPRRPRISRSRVIAKVGAQRAPSGSSLSSNKSVRRSLNEFRPKGRLSVRSSGIGAKAGGGGGGNASAAIIARKRLRQSEVLRRRSKIGGTSLTAVAHVVKEGISEDLEANDTDDDGKSQDQSTAMDVSVGD